MTSSRCDQETPELILCKCGRHVVRARREILEDVQYRTFEPVENRRGNYNIVPWDGPFGWRQWMAFKTPRFAGDYRLHICPREETRDGRVISIGERNRLIPDRDFVRDTPDEWEGATA